MDSWYFGRAVVHFYRAAESLAWAIRHPRAADAMLRSMPGWWFRRGLWCICMGLGWYGLAGRMPE